MLVNYENKDKRNAVEFMFYTGEFTNLCSGTLALDINGEYVIFDDLKNERFWLSGGGCFHGRTYQDEWIIDASKIPEKYRVYAE